MAASKARMAALEALLALEAGRTTLPAVLARKRRALADARDRGLLGEIVTGTLRWQLRLDALLGQCSRQALDALEPAVRAILRQASYQLEELDRVPAHAVVHDAVELTRAAGHSRAASFVNAVLRAFVRRRSSLTLPPRPGAATDRASTLAYLSVTLSHPRWLVERWLDRHGFDRTERWCIFNNQSPDVTVRAAPGRSFAQVVSNLADAGIPVTDAPFVQDAARLPSGALGQVPEALLADLVVQDEASQIVARVVGAKSGERVLDVCAAPGAKSMVLVQDLGGRGLTAADHRPARVRLLARTLAAAGVSVPVVALDATRPLPFGRVFDRVLVDAPCSGLGVLCRDPDLKWSRRPEDLSRFAETQVAMLEQAASVVRATGALVYATCSSEPDENEDVVRRFLAAHPEFDRRPALPGPTVRGGDQLVDDLGHLRTLPFRDGLDAFFAAVLVRTEAA
jgi:16S rRNA (cytosine967-C5)-methyltransferase